MISVIIPIYNVGEKLNSMFSCLLRQTYTSFEVLLVDDGSRDNSSEICDNICENDKRFKVFHQSNQGVSAARNLALKHAKGEFVSFLDGDDIIPENYFDMLVTAQDESNADVVCCDVVCVRDEKETCRFAGENKVYNQIQALNLLLSRKIINSGPCAKLFKANIIQDLFFPSLRVYEDILFVRDAFCNASKIAFTNKTEYRYITNGSGAMSTLRKTPSEDVITATENIARFINGNKQLSPDCFYTTLSHLMQYDIDLYKNKNSDAKRFIKKSRKLFRKNTIGILKNKSFPWKEKILFIVFGYIGIIKR